MEKRFWLGAGVLAVLLAVSFLVTFGMDALHTPAAEAFRQAEELALSGDMEKAVARGMEGRNRWQAGRKLTACVADHSPMDDVETLLEEMTVFARAGDAEHFAAACAQLASLLRAMSEAHSPAWWNLL